jgi:hypothetical protein
MSTRIDDIAAVLTEFGYEGDVPTYSDADGNECDVDVTQEPDRFFLDLCGPKGIHGGLAQVRVEVEGPVIRIESCGNDNPQITLYAPTLAEIRTTVSTAILNGRLEC